MSLQRLRHFVFMWLSSCRAVEVDEAHRAISTAPTGEGGSGS